MISSSIQMAILEGERVMQGPKVSEEGIGSMEAYVKHSKPCAIDFVLPRNDLEWFD